jgi:HK97 family phage prohead protease
MNPWDIKEPATYEGADGEDLLIKEVTEEGSFEGYASIFNKVDLQDDLVEPGAFAKSIKHHKGSFPMLWQHDRAQPIGSVEAEEDDRGLRVKGRLALGVTKARDVYELLRAKIIAGLSIGYKAVKEGFDQDTGVRRLKEILLWEVSAVTFPANPAARVRRIKSVVPYQDLPIAKSEEAETWDADGAEERIRDWAEAKDGPNAKYRRAFLWYNKERQDDFGAYELCIGDVVDGALTICPKAVFHAAAVVCGAKSSSVPSEDLEGIKMNLARYYRKMDRLPPWEVQGDFDLLVASVVDLLEFAEEEKLARLKATFPKPEPDVFEWARGMRDQPVSAGGSANCFTWIDNLRRK